MMRERMMRVRYADFRIGSVTGFARQLKRNDPRNITLQRQHLQVEHYPRMICVSCGHTDRTIKISDRMICGVGLRFLDATFDVPDGVQVLADSLAITRSNFALQSRDILAEPVEQARAFPQGRHAVRDAATLAKQALEHNARMRFCWQRRRR